nr:reverse transcriptase domain-containing protein [uncultured Rhodopila sp.]
MSILQSLLRRLAGQASTRTTSGHCRQPEALSAFSVPALERAFLRVRANNGGPGGDGVTIAAFDRTRAERLQALSAALIAGVYRPAPSRRLMLPKLGGGRPLLIPAVADRVAQTAWLLALTPAIDARMHAASFAYRPGRGVRDAVAAARAHVAAGRVHVVRVDIVRCFETVLHGRLLAELPRWIDDPLLRAAAVHWVRSTSAAGRGLAQGAPLSPLLANIYLDPLDRALDAAGVTFVRYADDIAAFARTGKEGQDVLALIQRTLETRGLAVNAGKSGVAHARSGVAFLGMPLADRRLGLVAILAAWWRQRRTERLAA